MSAQLNPAALPSGAIPMAAVTPLAGIVRWCALAPLYIDEGNVMCKAELEIDNLITCTLAYAVEIIICPKYKFLSIKFQMWRYLKFQQRE